MGKRQRKAALQAQKSSTQLSEMEVFAEERERSFRTSLQKVLAEESITLTAAVCQEPSRKINLTWTISWSVGMLSGDVSIEFPRGTARYDSTVCDMVADKVIQTVHTTLEIIVED